MRRATIVIIEGIVFWAAALMFSRGVIRDESGDLFIAIFAIIYAANTIGQNSQHMPDIAKARRSGALLFDIIESMDEQQISLEQGGRCTDSIKGDIEFRKVSFKYPQREARVLHNFSLKVDRGDKIGVAGESGSGKSTLVQLLMRIYPPIEGDILVDGRNIRDYDLYSLRQQIGVVNQEPTMFLGTVRENIIYNKKVSPEAITQALEVACCSKFVAGWE
jgi:ATP-binding cassette, subfamily B (MDR/TAP), member 1